MFESSFTKGDQSFQILEGVGSLLPVENSIVIVIIFTNIQIS